MDKHKPTEPSDQQGEPLFSLFIICATLYLMCISEYNVLYAPKIRSDLRLFYMYINDLDRDREYCGRGSCFGSKLSLEAFEHFT